MKKKSLSIIFPVHNEEKIIEENSIRTLSYLKKLDGLGSFEILLCPNGCSDQTVKIAKKLAKIYSHIKCYPKSAKGIGVGLKEGIKHAKCEYSMFYAIDLPFGLQIIEDSLNSAGDNKIIIGSKAHRASKINRSVSRKIYSKCFNSILRIFFRIKAGDTQGSLLFNTHKIAKILSKIDSNNAFAETQICIWGVRDGIKLVEIPVEALSSIRESKINPFIESSQIVRDILKEIKK